MRITRFAQAFVAVCLFPFIVALGEISGRIEGLDPGFGGACMAAVLILMALLAALA